MICGSLFRHTGILQCRTRLLTVTVTVSLRYRWTFLDTAHHCYGGLILAYISVLCGLMLWASSVNGSTKPLHLHAQADHELSVLYAATTDQVRLLLYQAMQSYICTVVPYAI